MKKLLIFFLFLVCSKTYSQVFDISQGLAVPSIVVVPSNVAVSNAALATITGASFSVLNGGTYYVRLYLNYNSATLTNGAGFALDCNGCTFSASTYEVTMTSTTTAVIRREGLTGEDDFGTVGTQSLTTGNVAVLEGIVSITTNGTLRGRFINEVSTEAITVLGGRSFMYVVRLNP